MKIYNLVTPLTDMCYDVVDDAIYDIAYLPEAVLVRLVLPDKGS